MWLRRTVDPDCVPGVAERVELVTIGQCAASAEPGMVLRSSAVGSGLVVLLHDTPACAGGMLYFALPHASFDEELAKKSPARFLDTGLVALLERLIAAGARLERLRAHLVGGADVAGSSFGAVNLAAAEDALAARELPVESRHVRGSVIRVAQLLIGPGVASLGPAPGGQDAP
jgi:chemotaxis protein CheD